MGSVPHIFHNIVAILLCVYFGYMSKNWLPIQIAAWAVSMFCSIFNFILPESPKYLISKHRYNEARNSIRIMARVNFKKNYNVYQIGFEGESDVYENIEV